MGCCMPEDCGTGHEKKRWCNQDGCGVTCAVITWMLLLFAEYAVMSRVIFPWFGGSLQGLFHGGLFTGIIVLALVSHFKAMTSNPGAVPQNALPLDYEPGSKAVFRVCRTCEAFKPERAHHCSFCKRCVVKMDHHCPWVNNCVAIGNHKFFLLFVFYVFVISLYAMGLLFTRFVHCSGTYKLKHRMSELSECNNTVGGTLMLFGVVIEAMLFGLFTLCMLFDQWGMVVYSTTQIDRLKGSGKETKKSKCESITEVFGGEPRFSFWWLIPVKAELYDQEGAQGYRCWTDEEYTMAKRAYLAKKKAEEEAGEGAGDGNPAAENGGDVAINMDDETVNATSDSSSNGGIHRTTAGTKYSSVPTGEEAA